MALKKKKFVVDNNGFVMGEKTWREKRSDFSTTFTLFTVIAVIVRVVESVLLALIILLCCASCGEKESRTVYYNPTFFLIPFEGDYDESDVFEGATEPTAKQRDVCNQVIKKVAKKYEITKGNPTVKCLPDEYFDRTASLKATARYDHKSNMILIPKSFDASGKSYFCHEYFHYLSDCDNDEVLIAMEYMLEGEQEVYLIGKSLNEGLTNYFSTQVYGHPEGTSIYEYETHVAAELAVSFGEEELWKAYTTGDWESIRNHFNENVSDLYKSEKYGNMELTPFDMLQLDLDEYQFLLTCATDIVQDYGIDEWKKTFRADTNSIEEMLLNYAIKTGHKEDAQKEMESLIANHSEHLDFQNMTDIEKISKMD